MRSLAFQLQDVAVVRLGDVYWEGTLADDDERAIDDGNLLSGTLEGLGFCCDGAQVFDDLGGSNGREGWDCEGCEGGSGESAEGNHFEMGVRSGWIWEGLR